MISVHDMSPEQLAALLHFHADAGVEWLVEDEPVDRFAEFSAQKEARHALVEAAQQGREAGQPAGGGHETARERPSRAGREPTAPRPAAVMAMPDEHAVTEARFAAESARSLAELKTAIEGFAGCNLKTSARSTVLVSGTGTSGVMVIGGAPSGDDDREGTAFSGRAGLLLERMLAAIGLTRETVWLTTITPWRPPGDRAPSPQEAAICRPFIERQIELAEPAHILLLGNFAARFFFGADETIHALRGRWHQVACGGHSVPALACLHPNDLLAAPAGKAHAWKDLMDFRSRIAAAG